MAEHTKGPWTYVPGDSTLRILNSDKRRVAILDHAQYWERFSEEDEANARRIVACVNALEDIPTAELEAGIVGEMVEALRIAAVKLQTLEEEIQAAEQHRKRTIWGRAAILRQPILGASLTIDRVLSRLKETTNG